MLNDPASAQIWKPDSTPAQISIPAEGMLKQDMQNLAGGFPFSSTSEARTIGANTATEASIISSMSQRSLAASKTQLAYAYARVGQQMLELNQQYIREPVYVHVIGVDSEQEAREIVPEMLQGAYHFGIKPMADSLMRAEKRSEAQTLYTTILQSAVVLQAIGLQPNGKAILKDLLEAFDKFDVDQYIQPAQPAAQVPGTAPPPSGPEQAGVTAPQAASPQSPSNKASMNPASMMQQFLASKGGGRNS
jgi:hypothetical protein